MIKDCFSKSFNFEAGKDTYFLLMPVPGFAVFYDVVDSGATPSGFAGIAYPTYATNFGNGLTSNYNYSKFRYAAQSIELVNNSNDMQWGGSISVWKADVSIATSIRLATNFDTPIAGIQVECPRLIGMNSITLLVPIGAKVNSFKEGCFSYAYDRSGLFEWNDFLQGTECTVF